MRKFYFLMISLAVLLSFSGGINVQAQSNSDKTILLVTNPTYGNDGALYNWLIANGFNVMRRNVSTTLSYPTLAMKDTLNNAQLVIVGRDVYSGDLNTPTRGHNVFDSITAPVITCNIFNFKTLRIKGQATREYKYSTDKSALNIYTQVAVADPIFANSNITGDSIKFAYKHSTFSAYSAADNLGTIIASHNGYAGVIRYTGGVLYSTGLAVPRTPLSDRTLFAFENDTTFRPQLMNLTPEGQSALYGEIRRYLGLPIEAPKVYSGNPSERTILLITNPTIGNDEAQYNWLIANGFNVERRNITTNMNIEAPTQAMLDSLNSAELVIIGRDVNSGNFELRGQNVFDSIRSPLILSSPFHFRSTRFVTPGIKEYKYATNPTALHLYTQVVDDPIFANSNIKGDSIKFGYKHATFISYTGTNGSVIASHNGYAGIIRYAKDIVYAPGLTIKPLSDRTLFSFETSEATLTPQMWNLTLDGQAAYYAEICRILSLPIVAPKVYSGNPSERTVLLITNPIRGNDEAQYKWLIANGFNVERRNIAGNMNFTAPTQAMLDSLNSAELVIIGRDVNSSDFGGSTGSGQNVFDNITAPLILSSPFHFRTDRFVSQTTQEYKYETNPTALYMYTQVVNDPIFANSNIKGDSIKYAYKHSTFINGGTNATVIARHNGFGAIMRYTKDIVYGPGLTRKPLSDRTLFSFETTAETITPQLWNLTLDGQAAYYAEICRILGLPIQAPAAFAGNTSDKSILLLSNSRYGSDEAQYQWLIANGFNVTRRDVQSDFYLETPRQSVLDSLNSAELVIIGRDVNSDNFDLRGQNVVDSITAPLIHNSAFAFRKERFDGPTPFTYAADSLAIKITPDPIFANSHAAGDSAITYAYMKNSVVKTTGHKGKTMATINGDMVIVRFTKDSLYAASSTRKPLSDRTLFTMETSVNAPNKWFSLSVNAQAAYFAEISRLLGLPNVAPSKYFYNKTLDTLIVSAGTLAPIFKADSSSYKVTVPYGTTSLTISSTVLRSANTVSGGGVVTTLPAINTITVTAPDFSTYNYYVNILVAAPSTVSSLSALTASVGTLSPVFASGVTSYTLIVPAGTTTVTLTATTTDANASITGAGAVTTFPSTATITVTAQDGVTQTPYAVAISKDPTQVPEFHSAGMRIYPNPVKDFVTVDGLSLGARVTVINTKGQLISKNVAQSSRLEIDLGNFESGLYLMKVEVDGKVYSSRFIKQ